MTLDNRARKTAQKLIRQFGKDAILRRRTSSYSPATRKTTEAVIDVKVKVTPPEPLELGRIDGTLVEAGDAKVGLAALGLKFAPDATTDSLVLDGLEWKIVTVRRVMSGELPALYELQLRS